MPTLSIVSDFVCPWCFIGKARLDDALDRLGLGTELGIRFLPFKLNPEMPPEGMARPDYRLQKFGSKERSDQLDAQVFEAARQSGLTINFDRMKRTPNTLKAHMLMAMAASVQGGSESIALRLSDLLFRGYFVEGADIGEDDVLIGLGEAAGMARDIVVAALADEELRTATDSLATGLAQQGVSGVPTLLIDQHFFVSGAVSAEDLVRMIPEAVAILKEAG